MPSSKTKEVNQNHLLERNRPCLFFYEIVIGMAKVFFGKFYSSGGALPEIPPLKMMLKRFSERGVLSFAELNFLLM